MSEGPVVKRNRVWNPALDDSQEEEKEPKMNEPNESSPEEKQSEQSPCSMFNFAKVVPPAVLPNFIQNYFHLAPFFLQIQQNQQMESFLRQSAMQQTARQHTVQKETNSQIQPQNGPPTPFVNPLVAPIMGNSSVNENSCATCGATFRLTADLVQHMRNNHRRTRFKRKNDAATASLI